MAVNKIEIQDENGDIYYPHTDSSVVFNKRGSSVNNELSDINSKLTHTQTEDLLVKQRILNSYLNKGGLKLTNVNDPSKNSYDGYWIDNGVLKVGASDKTRVKTPIIKITKAMDVTFDFPGYEWCSAKCSDASGNGASWDKLYAGGPTHHFEPGYQALLFKHNTDRELSEAEKSRLVLSFYDEIYSSATTAMVNKLNANTNGYDLIFPFITDIHHFPTDDLDVYKRQGKVVKPIFDTFRDVICGAMDAVLKPIQWVIDKLSELFGWIGDVGSKIGEFLDKINPFKSIDINTNINPNSEELAGVARSKSILTNTALSGAYYQPQTRSSKNIGTMIQSSNAFSKAIGGNDKFDSNNISSFNIKPMEDMFRKMIELLSVQNSLIEKNKPVFNLDGEELANKLDTINGTNMMLYGRFN